MFNGISMFVGYLMPKLLKQNIIRELDKVTNIDMKDRAHLKKKKLKKK